MSDNERPSWATVGRKIQAKTGAWVGEITALSEDVVTIKVDEDHFDWSITFLKKECVPVDEGCQAPSLDHAKGAVLHEIRTSGPLGLYAPEVEARVGPMAWPAIAALHEDGRVRWGHDSKRLMLTACQRELDKAHDSALDASRSIIGLTGERDDLRAEVEGLRQCAVNDDGERRRSAQRLADATAEVDRLRAEAEWQRALGRVSAKAAYRDATLEFVGARSLSTLGHAVHVAQAKEGAAVFFPRGYDPYQVAVVPGHLWSKSGGIPQWVEEVALCPTRIKPYAKFSDGGEAWVADMTSGNGWVCLGEGGDPEGSAGRTPKATASDLVVERVRSNVCSMLHILALAVDGEPEAYFLGLHDAAYAAMHAPLLPDVSRSARIIFQEGTEAHVLVLRDRGRNAASLGTRFVLGSARFGRMSAREDGTIPGSPIRIHPDDLAVLKGES